MLKNLLRGVLAAASRGEVALGVVAARKARQEREEARPVRRPGVLVDFKAPERETKAEERSRRHRERPAYRHDFVKPPSAKERRLLRFARAKASGAISFRPLGSALTQKVRKGLRWGHKNRMFVRRNSATNAAKSAA